MEHVRVFDTTLRDGEQCPGASMDPDTKVRIAHQLAELGVDVVEAGFPAASPDDYEATSRIAREVQGPVICAFARATEADIDRAAEALAAAPRTRLHTFIATSQRHMRAKGFDPAAVPERVWQAVRHARRFTDDVEFTPEDASRSDFDFLCRVVEAAIRAGATTVNIADTVGIMLPGQFAALIRRLRESVRDADRVVWSAHCHDDLGLAVANTLAAVEAGARQVEVTVGGIGERAGNAALEEVVMALRRHAKACGCDTRVSTPQIGPACALVFESIGWDIPRNKALVGANAFSHEAGIHQAGVLADPETYEILEPESVGWRGERFVTGKHSGRHLIEARLRGLGVPEERHARVIELVMPRIKNGERFSDRKLLGVAGGAYA